MSSIFPFKTHGTSTTTAILVCYVQSNVNKIDTVGPRTLKLQIAYDVKNDHVNILRDHTSHMHILKVLATMSSSTL